MAKKSQPETPAEHAEPGTLNAPEGSQNEGTSSEGGETPGAAADDDEPQLPPPAIFDSNDILPIVATAATTITGCTDNEVKNYLATSDYVLRTLALHLAEHWKQICRTAKLKSDEGASPKVSLGVSIVVNHENLLLMDTVVKTSFSLKHQQQNETQVDLRQVEFHLSGTSAEDTTEDAAA